MKGEWIWILLALFGILRLLMLAGKKKAGLEAPPSSPGSGQQPSPIPEPGEEVDELKAFIDSLTNRTGVEPRSHPPDPMRNWSDVFRPPEPPRPRPVVSPPIRSRPRPPAAQTPVVSQPLRRPVAAEAPPRPSKDFLTFSANPVVQGIIISEILGPPRGLEGGLKLPGEFSSRGFDVRRG
jgi:hypothetical protein